MDSALKQRLLGALVLIALAIIFVPMFLSGPPPKNDSDTFNLAIPPPPERKFETRVLPVDAGTAELITEEGDRVVTVETNSAPKVDANPENKPTAPSIPETFTNESKPVATQSVAPAELPTAAPASNSGRFVVNLGIYADHAHVEALLANMKKRGLPVYAEPTEYQGKAGERVRVGPYADRAGAEAIRLKIKQVDTKLPSSVSEILAQPSADAAEAERPPDRAGSFAVQLGAFKSNEEAVKLRDRLRSIGFAAFVDRIGVKDAILWRVRVGPEVERANAEKLRNGIKQKMQLDGIIVTHP